MVGAGCGWGGWGEVDGVRSKERLKLVDKLVGWE